MGSQKYEVPRGSLWRPMPEEVVLLGLDAPVGPEDKNYPFRVRDHAAVTEELIASVRSAAGVSTPIRVYKDEVGRMICVSGCRRVQALRVVNKELQAKGIPPKSIDAVDCPGGYPEALEVRNSANDHGLMDPPSKRADLVKASTATATQKEVAGWYGVSDRIVRVWLTLADMSSKIKAAVDAKAAGGKGIGLKEAVEWSSLSHEEQDAKLFDLLNPKPKEKPKGGGGGGNKPFRPKVKHLKMVLKDDELRGLLPKPVVEVFRWIAGDKEFSPSAVKGLSEIILRLESSEE